VGGKAFLLELNARALEDDVAVALSGLVVEKGAVGQPEFIVVNVIVRCIQDGGYFVVVHSIPLPGKRYVNAVQSILSPEHRPRNVTQLMAPGVPYHW